MAFHVHAVSKFAKDVIGPVVKKMDEEGKTDPTVIKELFQHGVSLSSLFKSFWKRMLPLIVQ